MRRILAIAVLAIRNAVRSRVVATLLGALLLVTFALPLTIKGDGTLAGYVRILLNYTLGAAAAILALATIWAGCAAISLEVQEHQLQLVVTKPVRRWEIWLGKWLGLVLMNGFLLTFCGGTTYAILRWTTRPEQLSAQDRTALKDEILTARRRIRPVPVDVEETVRARFEELRSSDQLPADVPAGEVLTALRRAELIKAFTVQPGGKQEWTFRLDPSPPPNHPLVANFRFATSRISLEPLTGLWRIRRASETYPLEIVQTNMPGAFGTLKIDDDQVAGSGDLVIEYANIGGDPVTVLFDPDVGLELMVYADGFEINFVRALLGVFIHLAFLAAVGVAAGSLFSMPVASFVALCLLLMLNVSGYINATASQEEIFSSFAGKVRGAAVMDAAFKVVFKTMSFAVKPLESKNPLDLLAGGEQIAWAWVARTFLARVALYSGLLLILSSWILNRREIALPST